MEVCTAKVAEHMASPGLGASKGEEPALAKPVRRCWRAIKPSSNIAAHLSISNFIIDIIAEVIGHVMRPNFVVFITDVPGVYDLPPSIPTAKLLPEIHAYVKPSNAKTNVNTEENPAQDIVMDLHHDHDVTGGMSRCSFTFGALISRSTILCPNTNCPNKHIL